MGSSPVPTGVILSLLFCLSAVVSFPTGAPGSVCITMRPDMKAHGRSQTSAFPYRVTCRQTGPNVITVRVEGKKGQTFRGLLAQVRKGGSAVGQAEPQDRDDYQAVCSKKAITHTNRTVKSVAEFRVSVNPSDITWNTNCWVTVVQSRRKFWDNQVTQLTGLDGKPIPKSASTGPDRGKKKDIRKKPRKIMKRKRKGKKSKKTKKNRGMKRAKRSVLGARQTSLRAKRNTKISINRRK